MRWLIGLGAVVAVAGGGLWWASAPDPLAAGDLPAHPADVANGERVFALAGCASCHSAPGAEGDARLVLAGGQSLGTPFGPIVVPNISPDATHGIGGWSDVEFVSALTRGVSPDGEWYVPAFPWTSYRDITTAEALDLRAYLATLPPSANAPDAAGLPFPYSWRRPIGLWAKLALADPPGPPSDAPEVVAGHHLVTALGHCGECHTPRDALSALDMSRWLAGGPDPSGEGRVPPLDASEDGLASWSAADIAYLLESGFTPDFDSVGGEMGQVVTEWAKTRPEDRAAVAAYLKALPSVTP